MNQGPDASAGAVPGTIYLDSIGLGSDLMPYAYNQGTSMATPAVAGAAAVIAGKGLAEADEPAKAAEKLTALTQGTAVPDAPLRGFVLHGRLRIGGRRGNSRPG